MDPLHEHLPALAELGEEEPTAAIAKLHALAKEYPDSYEVFRELAYLLEREHKEKEALTSYEKAWRLAMAEGTWDADLALGYGALLRETHDYERSIAILGEACSHFPNYLPLRIILSLALHSAKQSDMAIANLLEVILQLGEGDEALDGYEKALADLQQELLPEL